MKIAAEANTMITEIEEIILKASINNQIINVTNIVEISEDLRYLVQSNMENQIFQIQWMLVDELNAYKEKGKIYINDNIQEIQDLYKEENVKKEEERIKDKEVILVKPHKVSETTSTSLSAQTSFITDEVKNLIKYMKFIWAPTQTRIFWPLPHYQALKSRDE